MGDPDGTTVDQLLMAYELAGFLSVSGSADRAVLVARDSLARAEQIGAEQIAVRLRHVLGMALGHLRLWEPALAELELASEQAARLGDPAVQAVVWSTAAWAQARAGRPEDGLRAFARAHAVLEREVPTRDTATGSVNLGLSALQLGLLDISEHWFDYGLEHIDLLPGPLRRAAVWANRSLMEFEQGLAVEQADRPAEARAWYERCSAAGERLRELMADVPPDRAGPWLVSVAVNQGCCRAKLGDPAGALAALDPVMDEVATQTTLMTRAAAYLGRAWAELAGDDLAACRADGTEAARLAEGIGWTRWQADAHRALAGAADRAGDPAGRSAHEALAADLLAQLDWQARLRRLGVSLGLRTG